MGLDLPESQLALAALERATADEEGARAVLGKIGRRARVAPASVDRYGSGTDISTARLASGSVGITRPADCVDSTRRPREFDGAPAGPSARVAVIAGGIHESRGARQIRLCASQSSSLAVVRPGLARARDLALRASLSDDGPDADE